MNVPINKFSRDGFELGASKTSVIVLGEDDYGLDREILRQYFVAIRNDDPNIVRLNSNRFKEAADRGNYLEPSIAIWAADKIDELSRQMGFHLSSSVIIPKDAYRLKKYKLAASLDRVCTIHGGKLPLKDKQTNEIFQLENNGCLEIKTNAYSDGPPSISHILQVQSQMLCSGFKWAIIAFFGSKQKLSLYPFKADARIHNEIIEKTQDFWNKVENDIPYQEIPEPSKIYEDWKNNDRGLTELVTDYNVADNEIQKWTSTKNELKDAIKTILKQEKCNYVQINNSKIALDIITRKATVEQLVPAKPSSQYEKLSIKEICNE